MTEPLTEEEIEELEELLALLADAKEQGLYNMCDLHRRAIADLAPRLFSSLKQERERSAAPPPFAGRQSLPAALQDWMADIEEYLQGRHDIRDGVPGGTHPLPNEAMSLSSALKSALGEEP